MLRPLLGKTAFRKLAALARERDPRKCIEEHVLTRLGAVWEDVARLGTLLWIEQWSPLPLDRGLLDIDIAAASSACRALGTEELAAVRYHRCGSRLLEIGERLEKGLGLSTAPELCTALINAPNYLWNLPDAEAKRLGSLATAANAAHPGGGGILSTEAADVLKRLGINGGMSALDGAAPEQTFSVDWHMVPPGVLDPRDDTINVAYDAEMLTVMVRAAHAAPSTEQQPATRLKFRVLTCDGRTAASGDLALDPERGYYMGRIAQAQALAVGAVVDVFADGPRVPPPTKDRGRACIRRGAAWALALERLAAAGSDSASQELWREAATRWRRVTADLEGVQAKEEYRSWKHTAVNHQAACWNRAGQPEQAKQARSGLPGDQESSGEPQTASEGRPSLAELALVGALPQIALV
ncbi:hypothetical protein J7E97_09975 [Streptomyces sp. ISL-66]|uniref:hypothetical protein n=1 Tax=Streptomyces sp. ISL-66 TaxID=2819186 RepID=UPI001BE6FBCE|nr:hypothetical protein [Streptomyces sp. ISL-66]MBT2468196.1 hypothetical protein [Streptomyces sp. ISL-66]